jgi:hypothetical protein
MRGKIYLKNQGNAFIGIIIVLVLISLISGSLYYYLLKQTPEISQNIQKSNKEAVKSPEVNLSPDEEKTISSSEKVVPTLKPEKPIIKKCSNDIIYGRCSYDKPKYCDSGNLVNKCSLCGCSEGKRCQLDEECIINPLVLVIVNSSILSGIQSSINQYKADLESEEYKVNIISIENGTPSDLKALLQKKLSDNLVGAFLIGDLPIAWFERQDKDEGYLKFPTDFFYMDLDGSWIDADGNGVFDKHENGNGNKQPEIWIGRLTPNGFGNQIDLINNYFRKDHVYRKNQLVLSYRALVYEAGREMEEVKEYQSERYGVDKIYGDNITFVPYDKSSSNDYLQKLSEGYQLIYLSVHSGSKTHCFRPECSLFSSENIYSIDPKSFFYLLHACSASRYTENEYLGGAYVFAPSYGLTVIGTTDTGALLITNYLFSQISQNKSLGDAYKNWIFELVSSDHFCETSPICQYTFLGDPTLEIFP